MEKLFTLFPEFVDSDIRKDRVSNSYQITTHLVQSRHEALMPPSLIKGRSILDLGCCVGATGAWALYHGAKKYVGVEIDESFCQIARTNLSGRFEDRWEIMHESVEDFLSKNDRKYDIVMASGIIYTVIDSTAFLKALSEIAGTIMIESQLPLYDWNRFLLNCLPESHHHVLEHFDPTWLHEYLNVARITDNVMVKGQTGGYYHETVGTLPSMGYLKILMSNLGFRHDPAPYEMLKESVPKLYGKRRFVSVFHRSKHAKKYKTVAEVIKEPC